MDMDRDVTAFRERFNAYKNGKSVSEIYDAGLPRYAGGKPGLTKAQLNALDELYEWGSANGLDITAISGIGGNGIQESSLDSEAVSNSGYAGLWQNNKNLLAAIIDRYGDHSKKSLLAYAKAWINGEDWVRKGKYAAHTAMGSGKFKKSGYKTAEEASDAWMKQYERPVILDANGKIIGYLEQGKRRTYSKLAYDYLNNKYGRPILKPVAQAPITVAPDAVAVRPTIPAEQTVPAYDPTISPYISGKPMVKLRPRIELPNLMLLIEDSEWEPVFNYKNGKLPGYKDGTPTKVGEYNVYPSAVGASELNVTVPEVTVTGTDRRPLYQRYDAENSTYDPNVIRNFTDFAPVVGDIGQGLDTYNAFKNKDYLLAGVLGGLLLLPNAVEKPLKTVGKIIKPTLSDLTEYTYKGFNLLTNNDVFKKMKLMAAFAELEGRKAYDYLGDNLVKKGKKYSEYPSVVNLVLKNSIYPRMREMRPWIKDSEFDRMFNTTADNKWTMHPTETFKSAYGDESNVVGLYTPDTGNIAVKAGGGGEDISDILLHEIRHKLDDGIPLTEEETKILKEAYGDKFLEIPKTSKDWEATGIGEDYDMWPEAVTTNRDARSVLLGPKERYMNVHQQNQIIDKMSDQQIVEAVANANGYGRRFVDNLIGDGPLDASLISKEQIKAWREAMKKIGMFSGAAYLMSNAIPEYKNGKSPIHIKPANRGKFTALKKRTGHSASWFKENGTPAQKKMAVFALNSKKWHHADGKLPEYGGGLTPVAMPAQAAQNNNVVNGIMSYIPFVGTAMDGNDLIQGDVHAAVPFLIGTVADTVGGRSLYKAYQARKIFMDAVKQKLSTSQVYPLMIQANDKMNKALAGAAAYASDWYENTLQNLRK